MVESSKIKSNSFYSFVSIISRLLANSILLLFINNVYGKEISGQFLTAFVIAGLLINLGDFGLDLLCTTEVASNQDKTKNIFESLLTFKLLFTFIAFLVQIGIALFLDLSAPTRILLLILSLYTAVSTINNFIVGLFRGCEKLRYEAIVSIISSLFLLLLIGIIIFNGLSIYFVVIAYVISRIVGLLVALFYLRKILPEYSVIYNFNQWNDVKKNIIIYGGNLFFGNLFVQLDTLFLQYWRGDVAVGIYQAASRIYSILFIVLEMLVTSFTPTLARYFSESKEKWKNLGSILNKTLVIVAIPLSLFLFVYPEQIIRLVYFNKDFSESIGILRLFSVLILIRFLLDTSALMLTTSNKQDRRTKVVLVAVVISIPVYYCFIKVYGNIGAIIAALIMNGGAGIMYAALSFKNVKEWYYNKHILYLFLIYMVSLLAMWSLRSVHFLIIMPVITPIILVVCYYFGYNSNEKHMLFPTLSSLFRLNRSLNTGKISSKDSL